MYKERIAPQKSPQNLNFWLSAGTLCTWARTKIFWIWFICTLEGCVVLCTYLILKKVQIWNTLMFIDQNQTPLPKEGGLWESGRKTIPVMLWYSKNKQKPGWKVLLILDQITWRKLLSNNKIIDQNQTPLAHNNHWSRIQSGELNFPFFCIGLLSCVEVNLINICYFILRSI